jgi:GTPase SAR1 family protein
LAKDKIAMKKKIIGLFGAAKVGKSTTINKVYDILTQKYDYTENGQSLLQYKDIRVVIVINGIKIGIESQGDPNSRLKESLDIFVKAGCDIIVCATRTSGMTVGWVEAKKPLYDVEWKEKKPDVTQQEISNLNMANEIVAEIEKYL